MSGSSRTEKNSGNAGIREFKVAGFPLPLYLGILAVSILIVMSSTFQTFLYFKY